MRCDHCQSRLSQIVSTERPRAECQDCRFPGYCLTGNHLVAYKLDNRQPNGFVFVDDDDDAVFKALADASRRQLLDRLFERNGQTLNALCEDLVMTRQAVAKHLAILEEAKLVSSEKQGREKLHFINAVPINGIAERWINKFERRHLSALSALKKALEDEGGQ
ncbi:helix-turn-helix transcriptional regulator [Agrobacterium rhizogenes]|nr:helix-turn-helix transcriptional regulator [Rhizobium rhizogenes]